MIIAIGEATPAPLPLNPSPATLGRRNAAENTGPRKPIDWATTPIKLNDLPRPRPSAVCGVVVVM